MKREENVALGTAAQLRWTAARTEKRKASISRAWSLEALYCLYVFVVLCQRLRSETHGNVANISFLYVGWCLFGTMYERALRRGR